MKKVQVDSENKTFQFELRQEKGDLYIRQNGNEHRADLVRLANNRYSLIINGRSYEVGADFSPEGYTIFSGARSERFKVEDFEIARMKKKAGIDDSTSQKNLGAPMPGLIVAINCEVGDKINKNQPILVMEAMKMENDIKSPITGTVKSISVTSGQSVNKGQSMVEFE